MKSDPTCSIVDLFNSNATTINMGSSANSIVSGSIFGSQQIKNPYLRIGSTNQVLAGNFGVGAQTTGVYSGLFSAGGFADNTLDIVSIGSSWNKIRLNGENASNNGSVDIGGSGSTTSTHNIYGGTLSINTSTVNIPSATSINIGNSSSTSTINGGLVLPANIASISSSSGTLRVTGGMGLTGNANIDGVVKLTNTTSSFDKDSGALILEGGMGIEGSVNIGTDLNCKGSIKDTVIKNRTLSLVASANKQLEFNYADTAQIYAWTGDTGGGVFTLYSASVGRTIEFIKTDSTSITVQIASGTGVSIYDKSSVVARSTNLNVGSGTTYVRLICPLSNRWYITDLF